MRQQGIHQFKNESRVAEVIRDNAPESGIYVLPYFKDGHASESRQKEAMMMRDNGPVMFASILSNGLGKDRFKPIIIAYVIQVIGAALIAWMLSKTKGMVFWHKVRFVTLIGLLVGILGILPLWNWAGFPAAYVIVDIINLVIAWFLAGMAISKLVKVGK